MNNIIEKLRIVAEKGNECKTILRAITIYATLRNLNLSVSDYYASNKLESL